LGAAVPGPTLAANGPSISELSLPPYALQHLKMRSLIWKALTLHCPPFDGYADKLVDFILAHPEIDR
jgi:hypothetical protein